MKLCSFCKVLFTISGYFNQALHEEQHNPCTNHKTEYVNAEEGKIGKSLVYHREKREGAVVVGADVEHIKSVLDSDDGEEVMCSDIDY